GGAAAAAAPQRARLLLPQRVAGARAARAAPGAAPAARARAGPPRPPARLLGPVRLLQLLRAGGPRPRGHAPLRRRPPARPGAQPGARRGGARLPVPGRRDARPARARPAPPPA